MAADGAAITVKNVRGAVLAASDSTTEAPPETVRIAPRCLPASPPLWSPGSVVLSEEAQRFQPDPRPTIASVEVAAQAATALGVALTVVGSLLTIRRRAGNTPKNLCFRHGRPLRPREPLPSSTTTI
jgi:hypothetical protein